MATVGVKGSTGLHTTRRRCCTWQLSALISRLLDLDLDLGLQILANNLVIA